MYLMWWLFNLKMSQDTTMVDHLNKFNLVISYLSSVGIKFKDEVRALIFLSSLLESWNDTITTMSSYSRNSKLKYNDIRDLILSEEIHRKELRKTLGYIFNIKNRGKTS